MHPIKTGNIRTDLQFAKSFDAVINVIIYAEFDNQIEINSLEQVYEIDASRNRTRERYSNNRNRMSTIY